MRAALPVLLLLASPVHAGPSEALEPGTHDGGAPTSNRLNLRVGGATTDSTGNPTICLDVRVWSALSIESCGTGQAIIHNDPGTEMAHFRATWTVFEGATTTGTGKLRAGAGFAELQVGVDHPGFSFGEPDRVDRGSVAGPEAVLQAQYLVPLGAGVEAVASATGGVAVFAQADKLIVPKDSVQPFIAFEIGVGW